MNSNTLPSFSLTPAQAWDPLPPRQWNAQTARHLLRRAGWGATSEQGGALLERGPRAAVRRLFHDPRPFPLTEAVAGVERERSDYFRRLREAESPEERRNLQRLFRQKNEQAFQDYAIRWLRFASMPENAPQEKWGTFLQNIFVVSFDRVRNPSFVFHHHDLLRSKGNGPYPDLCKAVSRSPAMMHYLDLVRSNASAPNENFARELFELFVLGEGNYTEEDIKEAARAFTGYRLRAGSQFYLAAQLQDRGSKTVFGRSGPFNGDQVIDLAFDQPAARIFLPAEMWRFYLSDQLPPIEYMEEIGRHWRQSGFDLGFLRERFFSSRIFYEERFRGTMIKSPMQFHLGMLQDLQLTVPPYPRPILTPYRQMGQSLFNPPNVRGWVGGRTWINSTTLSARRSLVDSLFQPVVEERLNADDRAALRAAREEGPVQLFVSRERLRQMAERDSAAVADRFIDYFLSSPVSSEYRQSLIDHLDKGEGPRIDRIRASAMALLQSPAYHLC